MRSTAEEWAERVRSWRESGQTAAEFAAGKGFTSRNLRWWRGELERRGHGGSRVPMARVVRVACEGTALVVAVGAARIEVRAGFDASVLRALVDALGAVR